MLNWGPEPGTTPQELDELLHDCTDQKLRELREAAEPGTVWRSQLDAEARQRGWTDSEGGR